MSVENGECKGCGKPAARMPGGDVQIMTVGSVGISGSGGDRGLFCAECEDDLQHLCALFLGSDGLGICGCGDPESVYELVRDILALAPLYEQAEGERSNSAKVREMIGTGGAFYLILYTLDRAGLLEHGSSVSGSWLTLKGTHYLALMRRFGWDDLDGTGLPHFPGDGPVKPGDGECGPGCRHWEASLEQYQKDAIMQAKAATQPE